MRVQANANETSAQVLGHAERQNHELPEDAEKPNNNAQAYAKRRNPANTNAHKNAAKHHDGAENHEVQGHGKISLKKHQVPAHAKNRLQKISSSSTCRIPAITK